MQTNSATAALAVAALLAGGCGSGGSSSTAPRGTRNATAPNPNAKEKSPPGDIPDSTQFVRYKLPAAGFSVASEVRFPG